MNKYTVNVGNIGDLIVSNYAKGLKVFNEYKQNSINNVDGVAGEDVFLLCNGEIMLEYIGTLQREEVKYIGE